MDIETLYEAVELVRKSGHDGDIRETTFMRTYPLLLEAAQAPIADPLDAFLRTASLAYGWMPAALTIDASLLAAAAKGLGAAIQERPLVSLEQVEPIAACLGSVTGAAVVLHLSNPSVFPLWGPRVERFRIRSRPSDYHMAQPRNYLSFIGEVQTIAAHPLFLTFHHEYCTAYQARLQRLRIPAYPLTEPRVIESAACELAAPKESQWDSLERGWPWI
ncbi:hypothetical protein [Imhoffiella purpurea]|uniref:Uncharacterized protein n=1 Tax=Imhoffiella purpurea TaxID=1249627 RepID=W9W1K4_9GAMM|nr:hypothetical protein [Imhoffiella purpurea]EXJ16490.1 hypothetical protein D779_0091 [Imhoffiella purpurea]